MAAAFMNASTYEVLLDGGYFCDLLFSGLPRMPALGLDVFGDDFVMAPGWTYRTALALTRLNVRVGWAADFGNDLFSRYVMDEADRAGIERGLFRVHERPVRRISTAFVLGNDRAFVSFKDPIEVPSIAPLIEVHRPQWTVLGALEYGDRFRDIVGSARRSGSRVFMDCQNVAETLATPGVADAISEVDVFAPNESEAKRLTGQRNTATAMGILAGLGPTVVVKRGRLGCVAQSGTVTWQAAPLPVHVESTAGAGDSFIAGFLYGLLRGADTGEALRFGNVVGGLAASARDGSRLPTEVQLLEHAALVPMPTRRRAR
jgi:sugar/nucleoside kinase (ribokinase family)